MCSNGIVLKTELSVKCLCFKVKYCKGQLLIILKSLWDRKDSTEGRLLAFHTGSLSLIHKLCQDP